MFLANFAPTPPQPKTFEADSSPKGPAQVVERQIKDKQVHRFRIQVIFDNGDEQAVMSYEMVAKVVDPPKADGPLLDFDIDHYELKAAGKLLRKNKIGAGKIGIATLGLPTDLMDNFQDTHYWYPLLALYLPSTIKDNQFAVDERIGAHAQLKGTGTLKEQTYEIDGTIENDGNKIARVKFAWVLDRRGWPSRADGDITDGSGSLHFKIDGD